MPARFSPGQWVERHQRIHLVAEDFTVDNGLLTPKMSLKRRIAVQRYGDALQKLY